MAQKGTIVNAARDCSFLWLDSGVLSLMTFVSVDASLYVSLRNVLLEGVHLQQGRSFFEGEGAPSIP